MSQPTPSRASVAALFVLAAFFLAVGTAALWGAGSLAAGGEASEDWAQTKGRVVESGVSRHVDLSERSTTGRRYEYRPSVRYVYTVGGARYTAGRVRFGENTAYPGDRGRERAAAEADVYPQGADVVVHYDPDDPGEAVLEPGRTPTPWIVGVGGIALGVGLWMGWGGVQARRRLMAA